MREAKENDKIFAVGTGNFDALALEIFRYQYMNNNIYRLYVDALQIDAGKIVETAQIPFLPVGFFGTHNVQTGSFEPEIIFESSGTTGSMKSRHLLKDLSIYEISFVKGFEFFYGPVKDWVIIGLLPSYLERKDSSLVYMVEKLIRLSGHPESGFYLHDHEKLVNLIDKLEVKGQKTLLLGVSFALLDLSEQFNRHLKHTVIMETGGMKGRREEMVRPVLHDLLQNAFHVPQIHSEYGMTELLSQAYSKAAGVFYCPPWMRIMIREEDDPLSVQSPEAGTQKTILNKTGEINIIDLANIYSCSFIATDDVGRFYPDGGFEVLGRSDNSDLRGCSLMLV